MEFSIESGTQVLQVKPATSALAKTEAALKSPKGGLGGGDLEIDVAVCGDTIGGGVNV